MHDNFKKIFVFQFFLPWDEIKQCDQIGRFFKFLGDKISKKVAQMIGNFLGKYVKNAVVTF